MSLLDELGNRLVSCWRQKLALTIAINLLFWGFYSFLSRHALFPLRAVPLTWLDTTVGFSPEPWGWICLSQFLYTGTIPWLIMTKPELRRYVTGLILMCGTSFLLFLFCPVKGPRPEAVGPGLAMAVITGYDGSLNAF